MHIKVSGLVDARLTSHERNDVCIFHPLLFCCGVLDPNRLLLAWTSFTSVKLQDYMLERVTRASLSSMSLVNG